MSLEAALAHARDNVASSARALCGMLRG
jgi:hypothetical protein